MHSPEPRELMAAVREQLMRRAGTAAAPSPAPMHVPDLPTHGPDDSAGVPPPVPVRDRYSLGELLAYPDRLFVENAYRAILRREPDRQGLESHLGALRRGEVTKVGLLGQLVASSEAQAFGVRIDGLERPLRWERWQAKRGIGRVLGVLEGVLRLREHFSRGARVANRLEQMFVASLDQAAQMARHQHALESRVGGMQGQVTQLRADYQQQIGSLSALVSEQGRQLLSQSEAVDRLAADLDSVRMHASAALDGQDEITRRIAAIEPPPLLIDPHVLDGMYVAFEQRFRGGPELIQARMQPYLAVIDEAGAGTRELPVLDIGCGAGDWLDLLRANGRVARGVDTNRVFVELCRGRGLDVTLRDGIEALRQLEDGSCGAVTSIHVVEHLPFETLVVLLDEAFRVLAPGGVLILETPNPENITVATLGFYMDPTHRNPLPPEMLRWLVQARGFHQARIERLTAARELSAPPFLPPDAVGAGSVNVLLSQLVQAPDYAIVARRLS